MGEKKVSTLEDIDERDDDENESLAYTNDSASMGRSINFKLTQTKKNLGDKLNHLAQLAENM